MLKFGIIAEGPTDQQVIENILLGYFESEPEEPIILPIQPPRNPPGSKPAPGGWTLVFKSLERGDHEGALQYNNDYLVIQIDTDVSEEKGYDVPRREAGRELSVTERVERVIQKLKSYMAEPFYSANKHRILFAIAVDELECWLLPLLYANNKAAKTTGCLIAADRELRKRGQKTLSSGDNKILAVYDEVSRGYWKRHTLMELCGKNPSLELFIKQLDALITPPPAGSKITPGAELVPESAPPVEQASSKPFAPSLPKRPKQP